MVEGNEAAKKSHLKRHAARRCSAVRYGDKQGLWDGTVVSERFNLLTRSVPACLPDTPGLAL